VPDKNHDEIAGCPPRRRDWQVQLVM